MKLVYNDESHAYWLDGVRVSSATRAAKIPVDTFTIEQWEKRQVAIGMTLERRLLERVASDIDNREIVNTVCDDAKAIAGAHHKADRGKQMHRAIELDTLGKPLLTDQQRQDAEAWRRTLDRYGIELDLGFVEAFIAYPDVPLVGRMDGVGRMGGAAHVVDLKSGFNAVRYPQSTAVQLAIYGHAPAVSAAITTKGDKSEVTEWRTFPDDLDDTVGYVILLPPDELVGQLWRIDLTGGWAGAELALQAVSWRKRHKDGLAECVHAPEPALILDPAPTAPSRGDLVAQLGQHPDEGEMVDPELFADLEKVYRALDEPTKDWFNDIITESAQAGVDVRANKVKTQRRLAVYRGLLELAQGGHTDPDVVRALVARALDSDAPLFPTITVGHAVGALDLDAAAYFYAACINFAAGELAGVVDADDGLLRLVTV